MQISVENALFVSQNDTARLRRLIDRFRARTDRDTGYLDSLEARLDHAYLVRPQDMPSDVVTMNTRLRLHDPENGLAIVYTLVYPEDADAALDKISVLAPLGAALLGAREGESVRWMTPGGERHMKVAEILYQPEAAGHYHV